MSRCVLFAASVIALGGCVGTAFAQSAGGESTNVVCVSRERAHQPCEGNLGPDEPPVIAGCPRHACMRVATSQVGPDERRVELNVAATRRTRTRAHMPEVCCYDVPRPASQPNR